MNIELRAVSKIIDVFSMCPHLVPYIDSNDKTPLVDGNILLYSDAKSHSNKNLLGRIPVQVKGRSIPASKKINKSFRISREDLRGYLDDSGVLFLVVFVDPQQDRREVYYSLLNPFKVQDILNRLPPSRATSAIKLRPLPPEPSKIESIVALALQTRTESPTLGMDPSLWNSAETITVHTDTQIDLTSPKLLDYSSLDFAVTVKTKGGMTIPVAGEFQILPLSYLSQPTSFAVRSGAFEFTNPSARRVDAETLELTLSEGLRLEVPTTPSKSTRKLELSPRPTIQGWYEDVGFYLSCIDQGQLTVDSMTFDFKTQATAGEEQLRSNFNFVSKFRLLFEALGADPALVRVTDISEKRAQQLNDLYPALVEGEELVYDADQPGRILQPLGRWNIELLCVQGSSLGKVRILDVFSREFEQQIVFGDRENEDATSYIRVTPYDIVDADRIAYTLNLHLDNLVDAYEAVSQYPGTFSRANQLVLSLMKASGAVQERASEFLTAASRLNGWLIDQEGCLPHHQINQWQISARLGGLSVANRVEIRHFRRTLAAVSGINPAQLELACAILLQDADDIEFCMTLLSAKDLEQFMEWPIWDLVPAQGTSAQH